MCVRVCVGVCAQVLSFVRCCSGEFIFNLRCMEHFPSDLYPDIKVSDSDFFSFFSAVVMTSLAQCPSRRR